MNEDRFIDTEPDDAFAAVLGDIDTSPLMRMASVQAASQTPAPVSAPADVQPAPTQAAAPEPEAQLEPETPVAPPSAVSPQAPASTGLFTVAREGAAARVTPKMAMLADAAIPLQRLLRELESLGVQSVTLDLATAADMDADCLAVLIAFAGQGEGRDRLRLTNANVLLSSLFQTVRLERKFAIRVD
jgi:ABC-type transporter Mla MlaB component